MGYVQVNPLKKSPSKREVYVCLPKRTLVEPPAESKSTRQRLSRPEVERQKQLSLKKIRRLSKGRRMKRGVPLSMAVQYIPGSASDGASSSHADETNHPVFDMASSDATSSSRSDDELLSPPESITPFTRCGTPATPAPYHQILQQELPPSDYLPRLIVWLIYSKGPLTPKELIAALLMKVSYDPDGAYIHRGINPDDVLAWCSDYITTVEDEKRGPIVKLKEHVIEAFCHSDDPAFVKLRTDHVGDMNYYMAAVCTNYFLLDAFQKRFLTSEEIESVVDDYPFIIHAMRFRDDYLSYLEEIGDVRVVELHDRWDSSCEKNEYLRRNYLDVMKTHMAAIVSY